MQKTRLKDLLHTLGQQLIYTFDFLNDRSFFIELTGIIMEKNLNEPFVTLKQGDAPVQVLGEESIEQEPFIVASESKESHKTRGATKGEREETTKAQANET